jgi:hypothetical protein
MRLWVLPIVLINCACAAGPWTDFYGDRRSAAIPADVRSLVIDAQGCNHFAGEEPYDAERAAFLKKNIDSMCPDLKQRHKKLTKKYAQNVEAMTLMSEAWSAFE